MSMGMDGNRTRMFKVLAPIEKKDGGKFWLRVGSAFPNKDGSTNLYMDAWPAGTVKTLQLREMTDEDFARKHNRGDGGDGAPVPPPENLPF
jgi:hypothetical protein